MSTALIDLGIDGISRGHLLATGGSASVFAATRLQVGDGVAVKVLKQSVTPEEASKFFDKEERALELLSQTPGVLAVLGSGVTRLGEPFLIMPLFRRGSLADRLDATGPLPVAEAVSVIASVARTIQLTHDQGILHRDLKPQNLLVADSGTVFVADFGIARLGAGSISPTTSAASFTPLYAAPETFDNEHSVATDVYGLGATLVALLTGKPPFSVDNNDSLASMLRRVQQTAPPDLSSLGVPARINAVIRDTLAKQPAARPSTAAEVSRRLVGVAETPTARVKRDRAPSAAAPPTAPRKNSSSDSRGPAATTGGSGPKPVPPRFRESDTSTNVSRPATLHPVQAFRMSDPGQNKHLARSGDAQTQLGSLPQTATGKQSASKPSAAKWVLVGLIVVIAVAAVVLVATNQS